MAFKLNSAFLYAAYYGNSEHHTVRYVMMILSLIFNKERFNILPQLRTYTGYYPDIALETFICRPGSWRNGVFACNDILEAKPGNSKEDPFVQLHKAIPVQHGVLHFSRGTLTGVVGLKWRIQEYHLVKVPGQKEPVLLTRDFHDYRSGSPIDKTRPKLSREYKEGEYMDFEKKEEAKDIIDILIWRAQGGQTRDLCFQRHHAEPLPKSLTHSTLSMGILTAEDKEEEEEQPILPHADFSHVLLYLSDKDNNEPGTGGVTQEGDRMQEDWSGGFRRQGRTVIFPGRF